MKRTLRNIGLILILLTLSTMVWLQTTEKDKLVKQKAKIEKEIEFTNRLLKDTRNQQKHTVQELRLLHAKLQKRSALLKELAIEVDDLEEEIQEKTKKLQSLKSDLERARKEYSELIYFAFKNKNANLDFMYLLAAEDFNQFYSRYKYLLQYKEYRLKSIQLIVQLEKLIEVEIVELNLRKTEKVNMLNKILAEKALLLQDEGDIEKTVEKLKNKETQLKVDLEKKKKIKRKIEREIEKIIKKEAKRKSYTNLTPEEKLISDEFSSNKGRLPWPTGQGIITDKFGEHAHPVIKNLKVRNHGIDITTVPSSDARAVFEGEVTKVFSIKGANSTVILRHGNFYTVYHNLEEVYVKAGESIKVKGSVGRVYTDAKKGECILHFEVWKELEKQNPEDWLSN